MFGKLGWFFNRKMVFTFAVMSVSAAALLFAATYGTVDAQGKGDNDSKTANVAPAVTFPGTGVGAIPDGGAGCAPSPGAPLNITFNVTGIAVPPSNVSVNFTSGTPNHTFLGDIVAVLIAPNGASHSIFGRTGATTATGFGSASDLGAGALYTFNNAAANNWWTSAATTPVPAGNYRTSNSGGAGATNPMPNTDMNAAFAGIPTSNGTWTLRFTDGCGADTGTISAANLDLTPAVPLDANVDFNGDGKTDFVVTRGTTTPFAEGAAADQVTSEIVNRPRSDLEEREVKGRRRTVATDNAIVPPIFWYTSLNGSGTTSVVQWGDAVTDFITPEDFDGDGKDDIAVWREGAAQSAGMGFYVLQSSNGTLKYDNFGQSGDDPAIVGDYDGDNKADSAVFRCPAFGGPAGQCFFFYRGSNANPSGNVTYVPWGFGNDGDFFPYVGDFTGDGKNDFCIQRANPAATSQGQFVLLKSDGTGVEYVNWGLSSDFLIPGDYDGDGKTDFCVRRTVSGARQHWILTRTGATSFGIWGITGDVSAPGDYDGDGKTDLAIWRPSTDPNNNYFWVLNSSNSSVTNIEWGQCPVGSCDTPAAGWAVH